MKEIRKPEFYVVGAPKSGTTSLYEYLKTHPEIYLPRRKELLFFCDDLHFTFPVLNERQFLGYYQDWEHQKTAGEVSVWNLYSTHAARNIHRFNPQAKAVVMLRNPADMLLALHGNHVFNRNEIITDFEEAWKAERDRREGRRISPVIKCPVEGLYYSSIADYAEQLQRYLEVFGADKVKVILFDDFASKTKEVYADLLRFIGVSDAILPDLKVYNARKTVRSERLRNLTVNAPEWMKQIGQFFFPHQSRQRDWLMEMLWKMNTKVIDKPAMNDSFRKEVINHYLPSIQRLERMTARDLSAWYRS
jgi:hypothetical protein